ncbi:MAG: nickel-dependent lactate racemase family protein [Candidatus Methanospirareceae archaeon]
MVEIPYGKGVINVDIEGGVVVDSVGAKGEVRGKEVRRSDEGVIREAIKKPIGTKRLKELVKEKDGKIVIVVDDHTRKTPTKQMLDGIMEEIGERRRDCEVLVACGTHPPPTNEELKRIIGDYMKELVVKVHNCDAEEDLVYLGITSRGTPVKLNKNYVEADIRVLTGDITLHYYAGFGGGRKSILPGISSRATIKNNHSLLVDKNARSGNIKNNPVHLDMCEAASFAMPHFTINTIADSNSTVVDAYAGDMNEVFHKGVEVAKRLFLREVEGLYDVLIVSAGGFPKDKNLYQATKAIEHCYRALVPGGSLILVAECRDGVGDEYFEEWMRKYKSYEAVEEAIRENFILGGHKAFYIRKAMRRIRLSIISEIDDDILNGWGINTYNSIEEALEEELKEDKKVKIGIVRNGFDVLLMPRE